jgi:hypothetical protein
MSTAAIPSADVLHDLERWTALQLQQELDRLVVRARLVRGLLSARRRIEREHEQDRHWAESDNASRRPATI